MRSAARGRGLGRLGLAGLVAGIAAGIAAAPQVAAACSWAYPVGNDPSSPAPLSNNHPVGGMNLPAYGTHLGGDYWSGGGCTDYGQTVLAAADGEIVEIVDGLGSYLDVVVIRHEDPLVGTVYSMYGHISREPGLAEGQPVDYRQPIGFIDDVLAYFSPCHLHFEILSEEAYQQGPFCSGCAAAGFHVSPGYDQQAGVVAGSDPSGDTWLEVVDAIGGNRWYHTDPFIEARLDQSCGRCGDGTCDAGEDYDDCPADCPPCTLIPPEGGTLDDAGPCFLAGGSPEYWYVEEGSGHEGSYHWTHTTDAPNVDDYGVWTLAFAEAGMYRLEVYAEPGSADTQQARYEVVHGGAVDEPVIDQSLGGWMVLGEYAFDGGGGQSLRLDDNTGEPYADMVRIVFDGVRLTRLDLPPGGTESEGSGGDTLTGPGDSDPTMGGLDTSGGASDGSAGEGGTGGGPGLPGSRPGSTEGCACGRAAPRGPGLAALGWLLLPWLRRRRRSGTVQPGARR